MSTALARAADWPQWRGLHRDGVSAETIATNWPDGGPRMIWRAEIGAGHAPVSVSGSHAVTLGHTGRNDRVWCLDAAGGRILWQFDYPALARCRGEPGKGAFDGPHAAPTIDGTRVFTLSRERPALLPHGRRTRHLPRCLGIDSRGYAATGAV